MISCSRVGHGDSGSVFSITFAKHAEVESSLCEVKRSVTADLSGLSSPPCMLVCSSCPLRLTLSPPHSRGVAGLCVPAGTGKGHRAVWTDNFSSFIAAHDSSSRPLVPQASVVSRWSHRWQLVRPQEVTFRSTRRHAH